MSTTGIRQKLHRFIELKIKKAETIYTLFESEMDTTAQRKALIQAERDKYLKGTGTSYSTDEVRQMAVNKGLRDSII